MRIGSFSFGRPANRCAPLRALLLLACSIASTTHGASATVAVASNFIPALEAIAEAFAARTEHQIVIVAGSTGQLYAQITNGAPFDIFLSADQQRPQSLIESGLADPDTRFTYSVGLLVLWSKDPDLLDGGLDVLATGRFRWLAIANPELAPYGLAAQHALKRLGVWPAVEKRIVLGQNIAQTFAMAETRNAELGLVALSQAIDYRGPADYVEVPQDLYDPIRQDAVALRRAHDNLAARAFLAFLRSAEARDIIESFGYAHVTP